MVIVHVISSSIESQEFIMSTHLKKRKLDAYFEPVHPMETSETVRGSIIKTEDAILWKTPLEPKSLISQLKEKQNEQDNNNTMNIPKRRKQVAFFSEECKSRGTDAEKLFLDLIISKKKWIPKMTEEASTYDYLYHVDFMLKNPVHEEEEFWVDVKSLRATRRHWPLQSEYMWVELHSSGWLFGGKASIVAQQINEESFALFNREQLCDFVRQTVQTHLPIVAYAEQSYNRVYLRETKNQNSTFLFTSVLSLINLKNAYEKAGCGILNK